MQKQTNDDDQKPIQYQYFYVLKNSPVMISANYSAADTVSFLVFVVIISDRVNIFEVQQPSQHKSKKYGCRWSLGIKVKVKFSSTGNWSIMENEETFNTT